MKDIEAVNQEVTPSAFKTSQDCKQDPHSPVSQFSAIQWFILTWVANVTFSPPPAVRAVYLQAGCFVIWKVMKTFRWILRFCVWMTPLTCICFSYLCCGCSSVNGVVSHHEPIFGFYFGYLFDSYDDWTLEYFESFFHFLYLLLYSQSNIKHSLGTSFSLGERMR